MAQARSGCVMCMHACMCLCTGSTMRHDNRPPPPINAMKVCIFLHNASLLIFSQVTPSAISVHNAA